MKRNVRTSEKFLILGYSLILIFMLVQDWVSLGSLNDIEAITANKSSNELIVVTLIGVVQILLLMGIILFFLGKRYPLWAKLWLIIHPLCILSGAIMSWWIPYLFGIGAEEKAERFNNMFGNTHSFLPVMNGIVPNTLHTIFHLVLFLCIILTIYIFFTRHNNRKKSCRFVSLTVIGY